MTLSVSFLFSAINIQTASKDELMCIKGIGDKKADALLKYRKSTKLKSANDLINIKGFGKVLVANVKADKKSVACGGKKIAKKIKAQKSSTKKITAKKESKKSLEKESKVKKTDSKKDSTPKDTKKSSEKKSEVKKTDSKESE